MTWSRFSSPLRLLFHHSAHALLLGALATAASACGSSAQQEDVDEGAVEGAESARLDLDLTPGRAERPNLQNAYWMARMADLAYRDEVEQRRVLGELGVTVTSENYRFFDNASMQAFYVATDRFAILSFRGTEPTSLRDIWTDVAGLIRPKGWVGRVHRGFDRGLAALWDGAGMRDFVAARHNFDYVRDQGRSRAKPLFITGHSLGGALATFATLRSLVDGCLEAEKKLIAEGRDVASVEDTEDDPFLACKNQTIPVTGLFTFGAPRVGDSELSAWLGEQIVGWGTNAYRFVNASDAVTQIPGVTGLMDYKHVGLKTGDQLDENAFLVFLDTRGQVAFKNFSEARSSSAGDHGMANYVNKIFGLVGKL